MKSQIQKKKRINCNLSEILSQAISRAQTERKIGVVFDS
jgi:hypothetical protein